MAQYDYDVVVVGGGAAGLTASGLSASFGAKTLLVERHRLGGDCTWTGCVPSKTLLKAAGVAHLACTAGRYGLEDTPLTVDFPRLMAHVRATRQAIYEDADSPERLAAFSVETRFGNARFTDPQTLHIEGEEAGTLTARRFILCTGSRPAAPPIDGLDALNYLTNESLFELDEQPEHLLILGAGPVGVEMGQAFHRLGSRVTIIDRSDHPLGKDDPEHARSLGAVLQGEGVRFVFNASVERAEDVAGRVRLHLDQNGQSITIEGDRLLVAAGRRPNVEGLGLEAAGVRYTDEGITVDERCRTSQGHVWAAGDGTGEYQLTHMSEHMAKTAAMNAVLRLPQKLDRRHVPWTTFTAPELAHLGASEAELRERGERFEVYRFPFDRLDRAVTESETVGEVKVFATKWTGKILGASVLGERAGEMIGELAVAMKHGVSLAKVSDTIHPYPTWGLAVRRAADQWYARKQYPVAIKLVQRVFRYRGPTPPRPDPNRIV